MKTNPDYILRQIAGENILVPCGEAAKNINGLINLNDTAAFVWKHIDEAADMDALIAMAKEAFDVDDETAQRDVPGLVRELTMLGMVVGE